MRFQTEGHDVTCLCALVNLPKRVIVEELQALDGRARFQVQAFTGGAVGELLARVRPFLEGEPRVRRWQGEFAFGRIEVPEVEAAESVRAAVRAVAGDAGDLHVALSLRTAETAPRVRLANLVRALEAPV